VYYYNNLLHFCIHTAVSTEAQNMQKIQARFCFTPLSSRRSPVVLLWYARNVLACERQRYKPALVSTSVSTLYSVICHWNVARISRVRTVMR